MFKPITDHQPIQLPQGRPVHSRVRSAGSGILSDEEKPFDSALLHLLKNVELGVNVIAFTNPGISKIVFIRCRIAILGLQQADHELRHVHPITAGGGLMTPKTLRAAAPASTGNFFEVTMKVAMCIDGGRLRQVSG